MKALLLRADSSGCAYYRMTEPARAVNDLGLAEAWVDNGLDVNATVVNGETRVHGVDAHGAEVVVFQRPTRRSLLPAMESLQRQGIAVVVEVDDMLHGVDAMNIAGRQLDPRRSPDANYRWVSEATKIADWVTVSTPALLNEYARHGRGSVVPNAVPRAVAEMPPAYEVQEGRDDVLVGWTGSVGTHPWDLQEVGHGLRNALDRASRPASFTVIGQSAGARERLNLEDDPGEVPWLGEVHSYLATLGMLDIGIAPLRDDRFNRCKSWLKPLEYAARGVACVRSPVVEYQMLGIGYPAKRPRDWERHLVRLIQDPQLRRDTAHAARQQVLEKHLTEHTAHAWVAAWKNAIDVRKNRSL